jgi:hypothetical protein
MAFDKQWTLQLGPSSDQRRVESLHVADLQAQIASSSDLDEFSPFGTRGRKGLFDVNVNSMFEKNLRQFEMSCGARRNGDSVDFTKKVLIGVKSRHTQVGGDFLRRFGMDIADADEIDIAQGFVFLCMKLSKMTNTDHSTT